MKNLTLQIMKFGDEISELYNVKNLVYVSIILT
jgi:hypothetical protein